MEFFAICLILWKIVWLMFKISLVVVPLILIAGVIITIVEAFQGK